MTRKPGGGRSHEELIKGLGAKGASVGKAKKSFKAILSEDVLGEEAEELLADFVKVPDAWRADHENRVLYCYEVEVTSPLTENCLDEYVRLYWAFHVVRWYVVLVIVDRFGNEFEFNLFRFWDESGERYQRAIEEKYPAMRKSGDSWAEVKG